VRHYATAAPAWQACVLYESMKRHCRPFALHVLATDYEPIADITAEDRQLIFTRGSDLVARYPHLARLPGRPRNPNEYNCSVRWRWFADLASAHGQIMAIDGDMWFWSSPEALWQELEVSPAPWALTEHRFAPAARGLQGVTQESHGKFGRFNGGWAWFRDPAPAIFMANHAEQWAYQGFLELLDGRVIFGDQGWLALIDEIIPAHVIKNPGVNLAPWNLRASCDGILAAEPGDPPRIFRRGPPWTFCDVVLYHYSSLKLDDAGEVIQYADASYAVPGAAKGPLYDPYIEEVRRVRR